jgi:heme-degrading monooxygenase HmoA
MIVRAWRGRVPSDRADAYVDYLRRTGLADLAATPGNRGVTLLRRSLDGGVVEFDVRSQWDSLDDIRAFAGDEVDRARYYPDDAEFLLEMSERVEHWEVVNDR